jgi:GH24 family phage-related lysozyme (muramidase)
MSENTVFILVNGTENSVLISGNLTQSYVDPYRTNLISVIIGTAVTSIRENAFSDCTRLTTVYMPNSVTSIGNYPFARCTSLTTVSIGSGVTTIGTLAFIGCSNLTTIAIPNSVTSIGSVAFLNCTRLATVTIGSGLNTIGSDVFNRCTSLNQFIVDANNISFSTLSEGLALSNKSQTNLIQYALGNPANTYIIPDSVTTIGSGAFATCQNLRTVTIGSGVTTIGSGAFATCQNLRTVTIGSGVTTIGSSAFVQCQNLVTVTIGSGVTTIDSRAFELYENLASMTFNSPLTLANISPDIFGFGIQPNSTRKFYFYNTSNQNQINTNLLSAIQGIVIYPQVSATGPQIFINSGPYSPTITVITVPSYTKTYGDVPFFLDPSSNSPATFTYSSNNQSVATVNEFTGLVTLVSSGNGIPVTITVYQAETTDYTSGTANSSVTVNPSTPDNPVDIDTGSQLEYFFTTNASYAALENNITLQSNLINTGDIYKTIINPTNEPIIINIQPVG